MLCVLEYNVLFGALSLSCTFFSSHRIIYRFIELLHNSKTTPTIYHLLLHDKSFAKVNCKVS